MVEQRRSSNWTPDAALASCFVASTRKNKKSVPHFYSAHAFFNALLQPRSKHRRLVEMPDPEPSNSRSEQHPRNDQRNHANRDPEIGLLWRRVRFGDRLLRLDSDLLICDRRSRRRGQLGKFRMHHEAVALAWHRLNIDRLLARIAKRLAQLVHRGIDVGVVIDVRLIRPEAQPQLFPRQHVALLFDEREQHLVHLALQAKARAALGYFLALLVDLKRAEPYITRRELDRPGRSRGRIRFHCRTQVKR